MKIYKPNEIADLLQQVMMLKIPVYKDDTLEQIEFLVNHELKKLVMKAETHASTEI